MNTQFVFLVIIHSTFTGCCGLSTSEVHASGSAIENIVEGLFAKNLLEPKRFSSVVETWLLELPTELMLLGTVGDNVTLPDYIVGDAAFRNVRIIDASKTSVSTSMSGRTLTLTVTIPNLEVQCPDCTYKLRDRADSYLVAQGFTYTLKGYQYTFRAALREKDFENEDIYGALALENPNFSLTVPTVDLNIHAGTRHYDNGTVESFVDQTEHFRSLIEAIWGLVGTSIPPALCDEFFNCFLSTAHQGRNCQWYYENYPSRQSVSQILHVISLNKARQSAGFSKPISEMTDPLDITNKVLLQYGTNVIQTAKYYNFLNSDPVVSQGIYRYETMSENCTAESDVCDKIQNIFTTNGSEILVSGATQQYVQSEIAFNKVLYKYHIPKISVSSSDFQWVSKSLETGTEVVYDGLDLVIQNALLSIETNFQSDPAGIIQLSGTSVVLNLGKASVYFPVTYQIENGIRTELSPVEIDIGPKLIEMWNGQDEVGVAFQDKYSEYLQKNINDFLAGRLTL